MKKILVLLVLITCAVQAEIYKSQNEKGEWIYTDKPSPSAERMKLPPLSTYTPPPQSQLSVSAPKKETGSSYKSMMFVEPENDDTIRDNEGVVKVVVGLDPPLMTRRGHKIRFFIDESPAGAPVVSPGIILKNINRGTHVLGAKVLNAEDKPVFSAEPVTFHLHRESVNFPNRVKPVPLPVPKPQIKAK